MCLFAYSRGAAHRVKREEWNGRELLIRAAAGALRGDPRPCGAGTRCFAGDPPAVRTHGELSDRGSGADHPLRGQGLLRGAKVSGGHREQGHRLQPLRVGRTAPAGLSDSAGGPPARSVRTGGLRRGRRPHPAGAELGQSAHRRTAPGQRGTGLCVFAAVSGVHADRGAPRLREDHPAAGADPDRQRRHGSAGRRGGRALRAGGLSRRYAGLRPGAHDGRALRGEEARGDLYAPAHHESGLDRRGRDHGGSGRGRAAAFLLLRRVHPGQRPRILPRRSDLQAALRENVQPGHF